MQSNGVQTIFRKEQRARKGKTFAKEIELSEGITITKVTRQGSGEEPLS